MEHLLEKIGLRDYHEPEAKRRAVQETDLTINMSLSQALLVVSAFEILSNLASAKEEDLQQRINEIVKIFPNEEYRQIIKEHMKALGNDALKEIFRKQREIYSTLNH